MSNLLSTEPRRKIEVMHMNPVDGRFRTLQVQRETDEAAYCKKKDGVPYRFFKSPEGKGWTEKITRFLTVEGYSLICGLKLDDIKADVSVESFLRTIWGDGAFNNLPQLLRDRLNEKIGVTVTVKPLEVDNETQEKLDELKADAILYDADLENLADFGISKESKSNMQAFTEKIPWIMVGLALSYILRDLGILG